MDNLFPEFQPYKNKIPEFIIKLYHMLESKEYQDYLTWNGPSQILIKQPKKMQEKVLPFFFRHKHFTSFIRQLNMYRFSKVPKLTKQRTYYMYFKNQNFQRGRIKELTKITRNAKKSKRSIAEEEQGSSLQKSDNISIDLQLEEKPDKNELVDYKNHVKRTIHELMASLRRIEGSHPDLKEQLTVSMTKCSELLQLQKENQNRSFINLSESDMFARLNSSEKFIPGIYPELFPSHQKF